MNSRQISQILARNRNTRHLFKGVFSADMLSDGSRRRRFTGYPHCFVANTDVSGQPGTHWVAFYIQTPTTAEYFDSLGEWPPQSPHLASYLSSNNFENIIFNTKKIQATYEDACGPFSIYFLVKRCGSGGGGGDAYKGRRQRSSSSFAQIVAALCKNPFSAVFVKLFVMKLHRVYYK